MSDSKTRVVVAEDEALIRMDLVEMLSEAGYEVVAAVDDGEKAVAAVEQHQPDLVLMDVRMPNLDGIAAAERVRDRVPVVMLTAFSQQELVEQAAQAGAMGYLVKPFGAGDLFPAIEVARARFAQLSQIRSEVAELAEQLEVRKLIDRAKGIIQTTRGLSEPEAFRWIQRTAMDLRLSMRQVAEGVITHGLADKS